MSRLEVPVLLEKESAVRDWVRRRLGSVAHELRVARVAKMIFALTKRWHGLGAAEWRLLVLGALAHDVGRCMGEKRHARNGAEMILADKWLPLGETERRRVAYLARYHKGKVPAAGEDAALDHDVDDAETMLVLLGILRAADGLDSRTMGGPNLVLTLRGRVVQIHGYVEMDVAEAGRLFGRGKKMALLEEMLACEVRTEWFGTEMGVLVG
ncbi:MAG TPA: HD domain-containing protein [Phycisphaerae bacterium]|jgi:exopolyphosphatase/pppGpp-phosphohydrolase|nr:HD domain-containing protein [Phycisphaerae bacterium]